MIVALSRLVDLLISAIGINIIQKKSAIVNRLQLIVVTVVPRERPCLRISARMERFEPDALLANILLANPSLKVYLAHVR